MLDYWLKSLLGWESDFEGPYYTKERRIKITLDAYWHLEHLQPWINLRIGDLEAEYIGFDIFDSGRDKNTLLNLFRDHLGMNYESLGKKRFFDYQRELTEYFRKADILGSQWRTVNANWSKHAESVFKALGMIDQDNHIDCVYTYELFDRALVGPLLEDKTVLVIGHPATKMRDCLEDEAWRRQNRELFGIDKGPSAVYTIPLSHDQQGTAGDSIERKWAEIEALPEFDITLVAGSVPGKLLAGRIYREMGGLIWDGGYALQAVAKAGNYLCGPTQPGRRGFKRLFKGRSK